MKILIVTQYFLPQPLANAEVVGSLAESLAALGNEVDILTPRVGGLPHWHPPAGVRVHRTLGYFPADRSSVPKRLLEYFAFSVGALVSGATLKRPDLILVPSPPPTLGLIGVLLAKRHRCKFVYNVFDLYPEVALASGAMQPSLPLRALGWLMRWIYRQADAVVALDDQVVDAIKCAAPNALIRSIPNGIDMEPFENSTRNVEFLRGIGVDDTQPIAMYAGNIGRSQDLTAVIEATRANGAQLIIHGAGAQLADLRRIVTAQEMSHVFFSTFRPREELGAVFASADIHVVPLKPGIANTSVPSKLLSIFAAGRPAIVVAEPSSPAAVRLREANAGWVIPPGDQSALTAIIGEAIADDDSRERFGRNARTWALAHAGSNHSAVLYNALFAEIAT